MLERFKLVIKKQFFTVRVVRHCHGPPSEVVGAPSLSTFKRHLGDVLSNTL